jgi:hemolysin III
MLKEERFSTYSHLIIAIFAAITLIPTLYLARSDPWAQFVVGLAIGSGILCMGASANYHATKLRENDNTWQRKLDHIAIFFIIAGFFTFLAYFNLPSPWDWIIIIIQWTFVLVGFFVKLFTLGGPRWLIPLVYIIMGFSAMIPLPIYFAQMTTLSKFFLIIGAIFYVCAGIVYGSKKPDLKPGVFGFHELFHVLIGIGIIFYYLLIVDMLLSVF